MDLSTTPKETDMQTPQLQPGAILASPADARHLTPREAAILVAAADYRANARRPGGFRARSAEREERLRRLIYAACLSDDAEVTP